MRKYRTILTEHEVSDTYCDRCGLELKENTFAVLRSLTHGRIQEKTGKRVPRDFELCGPCYFKAVDAFFNVVDNKDES